MVTKEQIIKEMMEQLDFYAKDYMGHEGIRGRKLIKECFISDVITYNILMKNLFGTPKTFGNMIEKYIEKREEEGWE